MKSISVVRTKEETILLESGFRPLENRRLWEKEGICYGREAALQEAWIKLNKEEKINLYN